MNTKYFFALIISLALFACKNENKNNTTAPDGGDINLDDVISKTGAERPSDSKKAKAILDKYSNSLNELFTKEMAAAATGFDAANAKEYYSKIMKDPAYHSISYTWNNGRMGFIKELNGNFPKKDKVELAHFKGTTLATFKHNYHTPTDDELKKMDEMLDKNTGSDKQSNMAADMAKGFAAGLSFDEIPGVGDYAVWNNKYKELMVYSTGIQFRVLINVGEDENMNKEKSIALAKAVVAKL